MLGKFCAFTLWASTTCASNAVCLVGIYATFLRFTAHMTV